jgi:hypothetical protein
MKILRALMLVLTLSVCAYADGNMPYGSPSPGNMSNGVTGDMDYGVTTPPPAPATAATTTDPTVSGATDTQATENVTTQTLEVALSVMQGVLTVF